MKALFCSLEATPLFISVRLHTSLLLYIIISLLVTPNGASMLFDHVDGFGGEGGSGLYPGVYSSDLHPNYVYFTQREGRGERENFSGQYLMQRVLRNVSRHFRLINSHIISPKCFLLSKLKVASSLDVKTTCSKNFLFVQLLLIDGK